MDVIFWTVGATCDEGSADTEVTVDGLEAVVTPYDIVGGWDVCISLPAFFEHKAEIVFEDPETAQVVLRYGHRESAPLVPAKRKVYTVEVLE